MNAQMLERARNAYRSGDFSSASRLFLACKESGEFFGEADHLRGNSLMRLGAYAAAAAAYADALADTSYGKRGALLTNQGKALAAAGDNKAASESFRAAVSDASYATPYKAYLGLAASQLALGEVAEAGVAFRSAAIDAANPAPASALASLGECFVLLGRPNDAIESYSTALEYAGPHDDVRSFNAGLGQAFAAAGRPAEAVEALTRASADGIYQLTPEQRTCLETAQAAASAQNSLSSGGTAASGAVDPLDPLGQSGQFMPDPSDTGFFTLSESEMIEQHREQSKIVRKHRHTGLKVAIVIFVLVILAVVGLGVGYTRGFGIPSQQDAITGLFHAASTSSDATPYLSSSLSEDARSMIVSSLPSGGEPTITGMDASMTQTTALVDVKLSGGGTQTYTVLLVRSDDHLGWVVQSVAADSGQASVSSDASTSTSTDLGSASR